jgi:hypothetical protein
MCMQIQVHWFYALQVTLRIFLRAGNAGGALFFEEICHGAEREVFMEEVAGIAHVSPLPVAMDTIGIICNTLKTSV